MAEASAEEIQKEIDFLEARTAARERVKSKRSEGQFQTFEAIVELIKEKYHDLQTQGVLESTKVDTTAGRVPPERPCGRHTKRGVWKTKKLGLQDFMKTGTHLLQTVISTKYSLRERDIKAYEACKKDFRELFGQDLPE